MNRFNLEHLAHERTVELTRGAEKARLRRRGMLVALRAKALRRLHRLSYLDFAPGTNQLSLSNATPVPLPQRETRPNWITYEKHGLTEHLRDHAHASR